MNFAEFRRRSRFAPDEISAYAQGLLISDAPPGLPQLPGYLLLPFHEITRLEWDEASGTGAIEAVRSNRFDEWFYGCHFLGDPVMPGCWGVDAVWQCLKFFAAWRGLTGCDKSLGMENVSFFGQIRPYDKAVVYHVDILSVERDGEDVLITGKGSVSVDGTLVYTMDSVQVGTAFWEAPSTKPQTTATEDDGSAMRPLTYDEFAARDHFTRAEIVALSRGGLVSDPPGEVALLPSDLMLEVGRIERIAVDRATGEGEVLASRPNAPTDWFFARPSTGSAAPRDDVILSSESAVQTTAGICSTVVRKRCSLSRSTSFARLRAVTSRMMPVKNRSLGVVHLEKDISSGNSSPPLRNPVSETVLPSARASTRSGPTSTSPFIATKAAMVRALWKAGSAWSLSTIERLRAARVSAGRTPRTERIRLRSSAFTLSRTCCSYSGDIDITGSSAKARA